ncbi:MAG: GTPase [Isosphaeraceae bacterium]
MLAERTSCSPRSTPARDAGGSRQGHVLLSDTVGFIHNLPHSLVASFKATLEEARQADLLLHVVDASSPEAERQIQAVKAVLDELGLADHPTLLVLNKADRVPDRSYLDVLRSHHRDTVTISAATGDGLDALERAVRDALLNQALDAEIETGVGNGRVLAYLAQHAQVQSRTYDDDKVHLICRLPRRCLDFLNENGAQVRTNGHVYA